MAGAFGLRRDDIDYGDGLVRLYLPTQVITNAVIQVIFLGHYFL